MPYAFDPRRWERRDRIAMVLGVLLGAAAGCGLGYVWVPTPETSQFVARHSVLLLGGTGAVVGWIVTYFQGFTSSNVPPDYP